MICKPAVTDVANCALFFFFSPHTGDPEQKRPVIKTGRFLPYYPSVLNDPRQAAVVFRLSFVRLWTSKATPCWFLPLLVAGKDMNLAAWTFTIALCIDIGMVAQLEQRVERRGFS